MAWLLGAGQGISGAAEWGHGKSGGQITAGPALLLCRPLSFTWGVCVSWELVLVQRAVPTLILLKLFRVTQAKYGSFSGTVCLCNNVSVDWFRIETPFNPDEATNKTWLRAAFSWTQFRGCTERQLAGGGGWGLGSHLLLPREAPGAGVRQGEVAASALGSEGHSPWGARTEVPKCDSSAAGQRGAWPFPGGGQ